MSIGEIKLNWFNIIVICGICYMVLFFVSPIIQKIIGTKKHIYSDKNPDINKRMKAIRIKNAKLQKPRYTKRLVLSGDSKKQDYELGIVNGINEDRRVMEVSYKPSMLSWSRLFLVPNELLETTTLNRNLVVRANGIKPVAFGLIDTPTLRDEDVKKENYYRKIISDYWAYLLTVDLSYLAEERIVHNVATAPGSSELDSSVLLQAEKDYTPANPKEELQ